MLNKITFLTVTWRGSFCILTFRQRAGADVRRHAAAAGVSGVIAGVDLDLVAGEVAEAGDDSGFLGVNHDHRLFALKGLITFGVIRAVWGAERSGEEGPRLVGHVRNGAPLP